VRIIWIKQDIWLASEEAAGVGRLFQRRGKLLKLVKGCVLHTLSEGPAPRAGARDCEIARGQPKGSAASLRVAF
jgi:hypothetical protein